MPDPTERCLVGRFPVRPDRDGRTIKILNVLDVFTREALVAETDRSIDADHVVRVLDKIAGERGFPKYLRFDNGSELVAFAVAGWCRFNDAGRSSSTRDRPWQMHGSSPNSRTSCASNSCG